MTLIIISSHKIGLLFCYYKTKVVPIHWKVTELINCNTVNKQNSIIPDMFAFSWKQKKKECFAEYYKYIKKILSTIGRRVSRTSRGRALLCSGTTFISASWALRKAKFMLSFMEFPLLLLILWQRYLRPMLHCSLYFSVQFRNIKYIVFWYLILGFYLQVRWGKL